nr:MFS transporter [Trinickia violacea]
MSNRTARRVLAATSVSYTIVLLDASIVNVALHAIGHSLGSGVAGLQWVVNAYTLTFASLLMTGGTLGDRLGARNVYLAGLALFSLASALCGFAPTQTTLARARCRARAARCSCPLRSRSSIALFPSRPSARRR